MNKLARQDRARILHLLCEGNSIRAVTRLTGASKNTVVKLMVEAGKACDDYQDRAFRNLTCKRIQVDEIWSFTHCKQANKGAAKKAPEFAGDTWSEKFVPDNLLPLWQIPRPKIVSHVRNRRDEEKRRTRISETTAIKSFARSVPPTLTGAHHRAGNAHFAWFDPSWVGPD